MVNKSNQNLERKMYENPKTTFSIIVLGLLIIGFFVGVGITVNIYNSDHINTINTIEHVAISTGLIEINGSLYYIQKIDNDSYNGTFISETIP